MRRLFLFGMFLTIPFAPLVIVGWTQDCPSNVPHVTGTWKTLPYQMTVNPVSTTLLHNGKILVIAGSENDQANSTDYRAAIWDPTGTTGASISVQNLIYDVFCSGTAVLPHGRTLTVGGTLTYAFTGNWRSTFYDPATGKFAQAQDMFDGRWYATATVLGDGRVMAFSGLTGGGGTNTTVEIYDLENAGAGWGTPITEAFAPPLFPRTFLLPNGNVFFTGQGADPQLSRGYTFNPAAKTWANSAATTTDREYGAAVLLPLLPPSYTPKVMNFGGGDPALPANKSTETIDLSAGSPAWTQGPNMSTGRIQMNAVMLPDGTVFAEGGSTVNDTPDAAGKNADIYDPVSNTFRSGGTASFTRTYHSTALLLPDATVAVMGSNPGNGPGSYEPAIEIYTPRYLYDASDQPIVASRPVITGVTPGIYGYGAAFTASYTSVNPIASAVLVRPGSTTHAFDMEQRVVGLCGPSPQPACNGSAGSLPLTTPPNGNIAPPGYYMLFLVDSAGVPSKAQFVEISKYATTPPVGAIATPPGDVTINVGGSVSYTTNTTATKYSWIFPGGSYTTSTDKNNPVTYNFAGTYQTSLTVLDSVSNNDPSPPVRVITVLASAGNFNLTVSPPGGFEVQPGGSAAYTVTVAPVKGFTGTVSLALSTQSGLPAGVTSAGFSPPTITGGSGSSTLTLNTTAAAVPYATTLTITGTSGSLSHTAGSTLVVELATPAGLVATPSPSQVALSWAPVPGASGYQVGRALVGGGPYTSIGCTTGTTWTDTGVTGGTTYYYTVNGQFAGGLNGSGAGPLSSEVSAMPGCSAPGYAGSLSAARSGASDTIWSWTAGGAPAFDVVRGDLGTLLSTGGNFGAALDALPVSEAACLANDTTALSLTDSDPPPAPGSGVFMLLRPSTVSCPAHGTYDDGSASLLASRDAGIAASARSCP